MFPQKSFTMSAAAGSFVVSERGTAQLEVRALEAGANVTHALALVPKDAGRMTVGRAEVKYHWLAAPELESEEEEEEEEEGGGGGAARAPEVEFASSLSSSQGKIEIVEQAVYERISKERAPVAQATGVFAFLAFIVVPWYLMQAARSAEEKGK
jgi:hypothetical protein